MMKVTVTPIKEAAAINANGGSAHLQTNHLNIWAMDFPIRMMSCHLYSISNIF